MSGERLGYVALLRQNQALRHLWLGRLVSNLGDWFNLIALFHAVQSFTDSAQAVVLVLVVKTLPIFLMSPISGPIVDRFDRRSLMIAMDAFRALGTVGLLIGFWLDSLIALYVCVTCMVCATGIALPATNAALPMLTEVRHVPMANALLGGTWSVSLALGAALGGVATELLGITAAMCIDGASFILSGLLAARLPKLPAPAVAESASESTNERGRGRRDAPSTGFIDGLRYLRRAPYILCVTSLKSLLQLAGGLNGLMALYGTVVFANAAGPLYIGILYASRGVGAAIGSLWLRTLFGDDIRTMRKLIIGGYALSGLAFAGLAMATAFWHAAIAFFVSAIGHAVVYVFSGSLLQLEADRRYHGRIFALDIGVMTLVGAVSGYSYGLALDLGASFSAVVLIGASLALIPIVLWSAVTWRTRA